GATKIPKKTRNHASVGVERNLSSGRVFGVLMNADAAAAARPMKKPSERSFAIRSRAAGHRHCRPSKNGRPHIIGKHSHAAISVARYAPACARISTRG